MRHSEGERVTLHKICIGIIINDHVTTIQITSKKSQQSS